MLAQILYAGFRIGEISCPAAYFDEASSINFVRSVKYGLGVLGGLAAALPAAEGDRPFAIFDPNGRRLESAASAASSATRESESLG